LNTQTGTGTSHRSTLLPGLYCAVLAAFLYLSFRVAAGYAAVEPDSSHSLIVWQGIQAHGWAWLRDWTFTQDNWLFSLFPLHFLGYLVAGATPLVPLVGGWLIYAASALLAGSIARQSGSRVAQFVLPVVLLVFGPFAHVAGMAAYATTHNITNLYGLASVWILLRWLRNPEQTLVHWCAFTFVLLSASLSDPWMLAAYVLPWGLLGMIALFIPRLLPLRLALQMGGSACLVLVLAKTHLLGGLALIPAVAYELGSPAVWGANLYQYIGDAGGLFRLLPHDQSAAFWLDWGSFAIVAGLLVRHLISAWRAGMYQDQLRCVLIAVALLSCGGISAAYVLNAATAYALAARFLLNIPYLVILILGVLLEYNWSRMAKAERLISLALVVLFIASGVVSTKDIWSNSELEFNDRKVARITAFLDEQGLNYGFGPYWGLSGNAITAYTHGRQRIRPVIFDATTGMLTSQQRPQTSSRWYTPQDIPADATEFFVVVMDDGEQCPDVALCRRGLLAQFGNPSRTLQFNDQAEVLVWADPGRVLWLD